MKKLSKIFKIVGVFLFVFVFCSSMLLLPAGKSLSAAGNGIKVFIDPGHGGRDPGAVWNGLKEKDANLAIANRLKAKLEAAGFTVIMRRTGDQYHTLDQIVSMANNSNADIFISIHNNASVSTSAHGTETYWCANGVNGSSQLANLVQSRLLSQIGRANRGVKTANFRVIKYTNMPAALVECAFVSNPTEAALLKTGSFQEKCAVGLFNAINEFSKGINKDTGDYTGGSGDSSAGFSVIVDYPSNNTTVSSSFLISGWAADLNNIPPKELAKVEIYKGTEKNESNFLGTCSRFERPDLGRSDILNSGYMLRVNLDSLVKGENILGVYAYDTNGNYSYNMVKINVVKEDEPEEQPNSIPVANPGGPYEGIVDEEITFDGSASTDSDGSIAEYIWDFGDGNSGSGAGPVHTYSEAGTYLVKLTVKDDKDAQSATVQVNATISESEGEEEDEEDTSGEGEVSSVSNSTVVVGYREVTVGQLVSLFTGRDSDKTERATRLAELYIQYGQLFDIRADIAWAQMCHETGFLEFTGDVKPDQNNFCGMGAVAPGIPGNSFATEELGVIAHYAHLAWYYYPDHVNEYCSNQYDPRHFDNSHYRYTGDTTLGFLNGRWAPGSTYTGKIILFANEVWQASDDETGTTDYSVTADAGQDISANVGEELTFDASSSVISPVSEAGAITYQWDWDNDGEYDITTEDLTVKHVFGDAGEYEVKLKVTAFEDIESEDTVMVSINAYPVADPGGPYEGTVDEEIAFDGSASIDSDGDITEYAWDFGDGNSGSGAGPVHTYDEAGTYTLTLEVKDDAGAASIPEYTEVVIGEESEQSDDEDEGDDEGDGESAENAAPTADPGGPYEGTVDEEITFDGSASTDSDGSIAEYTWDFGDEENGSGVDPVHTYTEAGSYTVTLTVKDDDDELSDGESTTVTITEAEGSGEEDGDEDDNEGEEDENEDEPEEVISRAIGEGVGVFTMVVDYPKRDEDVSGRVVISGWAADLKNKSPIQLAKVEIYNGSGRYKHNFIGTARIFKRPDLGRIDILNSGYILGFSLESIPEGENTFWIYAYDSNNNYRCASVKVNVVKEEAVESGDDGESDGEGESGSSDEEGDGETTENVAPTADPGGPYEGTAGQEITFDGSASTDSDGSIAEYTWDFGDGSTGTGEKPKHTYTNSGNYAVTLKVKDDGDSLSDAVSVSVAIKEAEKTYPANTSPITNGTSVVDYKEVTVDQLVKLFVDRNSSQLERARRIAPIYIKYGRLFNLRADIAWAMMCHETGFLEYTGDVKPNQNNFCGMGAVGGGVPGDSFATEELGVIAHYAHLAWYYYPEHVNEYCSSQYDPRHFGSSHYKYTGDTTLGFLNGRWAPGATYTSKIILFANQIYGF